MRDEVCSLRQSYQMARMYRASTSGRVSRGLAVKSSAQSAETRLTVHIHHRHLLLLLRAPRPASLSTYTIAIYCYYPERRDPTHSPHTPSPFIVITRSAETRLAVDIHHRHLLLLLRAQRPASQSTYTIAIYCYYSERRDPPRCPHTPSPFIAITQSAQTRLSVYAHHRHLLLLLRAPRPASLFHTHHRHLLLLLRAPRPASLSTYTIAIYCYYSERRDPPHSPHTPSPFIAITQSAQTRLTVYAHHRHLLLLLRAPRPASLSTYTIAIYCYYSEPRDPPRCPHTPSPFIAITQSAETRLTFHIHHRHLLLLLRAPRPASLSTHTIAIYCYYSERRDPPHSHPGLRRRHVSTACHALGTYQSLLLRSQVNGYLPSHRVLLRLALLVAVVVIA